MGALHGSATHVQRRRQNPLDLQCLGAHGCAYDVDDGISRADFVEVDLLNLNVVDLCLGVPRATKISLAVCLARSLMGAASMIFRIC